ncbi:MAG TPA: NADH-quinone oxidoreductase subunit A [bacterium]|nr:NADH-quinone oxidoreductase subunit A [bacterium]HPR87015.1 NADH-quinone oxidoreductase subunit A [bacterium]
MLHDLLPLLLLFAVAAFLGGAILLLTHLFGPSRPNPLKLSAYESGKIPIGGPRIRFSIRFYIIAMLFVLFDIELVFFYPWAVVFRQYLSLGGFIFVEMIVFIGLLLAGYLYAWKKGALEWE